MRGYRNAVLSAQRIRLNPPPRDDTAIGTVCPTSSSTKQLVSELAHLVLLSYSCKSTISGLNLTISRAASSMPPPQFRLTIRILPRAPLLGGR